jgi:hypothetical protein
MTPAKIARINLSKTYRSARKVPRPTEPVQTDGPSRAIEAFRRLATACGVPVPGPDTTTATCGGKGGTP